LGVLLILGFVLIAQSEEPFSGKIEGCAVSFTGLKKAATASRNRKGNEESD
jgi:hypothetical protein